MGRIANVDVSTVTPRVRIEATEPFLAAVAQALAYGLYDLTRLESLILKQVRGVFFQLRPED